jgi:type I restriction enzyme S subunit
MNTIKNEVGMSWDMVKLGDLCKMSSGGTPSRSNLSFYNGAIPWAKISDIENAEGGIIQFTEEHITSEGLASINNRIFVKGTLLLAMYGSVGKVAFAGMEMSTNQAILGIKVKDENKLSYSYLKYWFQTIKEQLLNRAVGGTLQNISLGIVKDLLIPLPPLATQKRIAEILDAADALRRKNQELLKKYDELAQAIFIDMFGDPVKNEKGWEVKRLGDLTHMITDGKHGNCNDEENSGYYFISAKDIFNDRINYSNSRQIPITEFEEVDRRTNLQVGDMVMVNTGATIGKLAIVEDIPETRKTTFQKSVAVIKLNHNYVIPEFLKYVFILRIKSFANKGTGSAVQNLLLSEMRNFLIIKPPIEIQKKFIEKTKLLSFQKLECTIIESKSNYLFNSLIQKAFKGELV